MEVVRKEGVISNGEGRRGQRDGSSQDRGGAFY